VRARLEIAVLAVAALVVAAFIASFVLGMRRTSGDADAGSAAGERAPAPRVVTPPVGRVEVLNASRRAGTARAATDRLRAADFDVVYFGNAPGSPADSSLVIDRVGRSDIASAAAASLGIARTTSQIDTALYVDATVILGTDWAGPGAAARPEAAPHGDGDANGERWRDRLRRWLQR
jgi:hypothetical protein